MTVATALHWCESSGPLKCMRMHACLLCNSLLCGSRFDVPAFYKEARRVLKRGGALAAWCYYLPAIKGHARADEVLQGFFYGVMGPYHGEAHEHCEQEYRDIEPGSEDFGVIERTSLPFEQQSSIRHLVCRP